MHVADLMEPGCLEDVYRSYEAVFWELWVKLFPYVGISLGCFPVPIYFLMNKARSGMMGLELVEYPVHSFITVLVECARTVSIKPRVMACEARYFRSPL
jgi:hypothetical protein